MPALLLRIYISIVDLSVSNLKICNRTPRSSHRTLSLVGLKKAVHNAQYGSVFKEQRHLSNLVLIRDKIYDNSRPYIARHLTNTYNYRRYLHDENLVLEQLILGSYLNTYNSSTWE